MSAFRVLQLPAQDDFLGEYMLRIPVIPSEYHGVSQTVIVSGQYPTIEDVLSDLNYYGVGPSFISLFTDLRSNKIPLGNPPSYDAAALLNQVYPSIESIHKPQDTTLSSYVRLYDTGIILPSTVTVSQDGNDTDVFIHASDSSFLLRHATTLHDSGGGTSGGYSFQIEVCGVYADQLNGNKFDFSGDNQDAARITVSCSRDIDNTYFIWAQILGGSWPIGINLKNHLDGKEADDADQDSDDPYDDGGDSGGGGGGGSFDDDSDDVDFPPLPDISAADTGFISLYVPSATQLKDLANYMWNNNLFDIDSFKKLFADPMDCVIGLSIVPYAVPSSGAVTVNVGNIPTGVSMNKASGQFFILDCGSINVSEYFGSYLDYSPYTSIQIFLPYIGYRDLKIDECMAAKPGMTVHLKYYIDILSGACTALIKCGKSMMFQFQGQCGVEIPFTGVEWGNTIKSAIEASTAIANISAGNGNINNEIGAVANAVMTCKPQVERSGKIGNAGGLIAGQHPYLIITRPRQCKPKNQNHYLGYPAFITESLGGISGFTQMEECRLNGIKCNDEEMEEIMRLLKEGVIL